MVKRAIRQIKNLRSNPLATGSALMMGSSIFVNFLNYIFNIFMVRFLGPAGYGTFASLISMLIIISVPSAALTTTTAKFVAQYKGENDESKIKILLSKLLKYLSLAGLISFLIIFLFSGVISSYLKIESPLQVIIIGVSFLVILPQTVTLGGLQGLQSFTFLSLNSIFSAFIKLVVGLGLVALGFSVNGALTGFFFAYLFPFLASFYVIRKFLTGGQGMVSWKSFLKYMPFAIISVLGMQLLTSSDIVLVKHYFNSYDAGIYSALSLVGRVILFASSQVPVVMFPLIAERYSSKKRYHHYLLYSLLLVGLISLSITAFYFLFPQFSIKFFFGNKFLSAAPYLWYFAIFITLYSICNVLVNFFLSIHKTKIALLAIFASVAQWVLISVFHSNFWQVISVSVSVTALLTLLLMLYLLFDDDFRYRSRLQAGKND